MFRSVAWGGSAITSSISSTLGVSPEEADQIKLDYSKFKATQGEKDVVVALQESVNSLLSDLNQTLIAYRNQIRKTFHRLNCGR